MISIIDYGVSNYGAIQNMFRKIGIETEVIDNRTQVLGATKLILPGVGAYDHGMRELRQRSLDSAIIQAATELGTPLLGICLGMQLLGSRSEEGSLAGLGLIPGVCRRFKFDPGSQFKVPQMGWNTVTPIREDKFMERMNASSRFYFVHSYHFVPDASGDALATTQYGEEFVSVIGRESVFGVQFHPEKSHRFGMELLSSFADV